MLKNYCLSIFEAFNKKTITIIIVFIIVTVIIVFRDIFHRFW